jgi:hypothetical protein
MATCTPSDGMPEYGFVVDGARAYDGWRGPVPGRLTRGPPLASWELDQFPPVKLAEAQGRSSDNPGRIRSTRRRSSVVLGCSAPASRPPVIIGPSTSERVFAGRAQHRPT